YSWEPQVVASCVPWADDSARPRFCATSSWEQFRGGPGFCWTRTAMANRRHIFVAAFALTLIASVAALPAAARLPWAATHGTHFVEAIVNADNYRMRAAAMAINKSPSSD